MKNVLTVRHMSTPETYAIEAEERIKRRQKRTKSDLPRRTRLLLLLVVVPAISGSLFISVATVAQPIRQSIEIDRCSSPRFQVETINGFRLPVLQGTNSPLVPVDSSIKWRCDHVEEWTSCPSDTNFAVFRRDPPNSRRITVDCVNDDQVDHELGTEYSHPSLGSYQLGGIWTGYGFNQAKWYVGDFNGDGNDDLLRQINKWGGGDVLLSNGHNSFGAPSRWTGAGFNQATWYVGDFNGDGRDDLLRQSRLYGGADVLLSRGDSFGPPQRWTESGFNFYGWTVTDFDGDGRDDLVGVTTDGFLKTLRSTGNRYFVVNSIFNYSYLPGYAPIYSADINGDSRDDLLYQLNTWGGAEALISDGI